MHAYIDICSDSSEYWELDDIEDYCLVKPDPNDYSKNISKKIQKRIKQKKICKK